MGAALGLGLGTLLRRRKKQQQQNQTGESPNQSTNYVAPATVEPNLQSEPTGQPPASSLRHAATAQLPQVVESSLPDDGEVRF